MSEKRPLMMLDERMAETRKVPVHPETGEEWEEKMWELRELAERWHDEPDERDRIKREYEAACEGVKFEKQPLIHQQTLLIGSELLKYHDTLPPQRKILYCHPKTWEKLPDSVKEGFELSDASRNYTFLEKA